MEASSASGRFHAAPVIVPEPSSVERSRRIARAGEVVCSCCRRSPLVGEEAILHVSDEREAWACELCERSASKSGPLGEVRGRVRVRPALVGSEPYRAA